MPTDYNMPRGWEAMSAEELDRWFKQERARRQAMNQDTTFARRAETARRRQKRRAEARNTAQLSTDDE